MAYGTREIVPGVTEARLDEAIRGALARLGFEPPAHSAAPSPRSQAPQKRKAGARR